MPPLDVLAHSRGALVVQECCNPNPRHPEAEWPPTVVVDRIVFIGADVAVSSMDWHQGANTTWGHVRRLCRQFINFYNKHDAILRFSAAIRQPNEPRLGRAGLRRPYDNEYNYDLTGECLASRAVCHCRNRHDNLIFCRNCVGFGHSIVAYFLLARSSTVQPFFRLPLCPACYLNAGGILKSSVVQFGSRYSGFLSSTRVPPTLDK